MNQISFSREKTQILKGIALLLMLVHHTVSKDYWTQDQSLLASTYDFVGHSTKMCVWIFAFLVGYGFFCSKNKTIRYSLKRIILLIIPFWAMLFFLFIPASYASGRLADALCNNHWGASPWMELFYNMFGFSESLNWYSWFVGFYCFCILMMPSLHKQFERFSRLGWLAAIIGYYILAIAIHMVPHWEQMPIINTMFTTCTLIPLIIVGYMCAKWNSEEKIPQWFEGKKRLPLALLTIIVVMFINGLSFDTKGFCMQAFYTPLLVFAVVGIFNSFELKWLSKGLTMIGDLSMYMWFFHAIFFTETVNLYTKNLVFEPIHNYFYTLFMTFVFTYCGSWVIKKLLTPIIDKIK